MASVFDGMAGALNSIFGAPILVFPAVGRSFTVQSIFREEPIQVTGEDGRDVLITAPTWKVPQDLARALRRGDRIQPVTGGPWFKVLNQIHSGSPATDRFVIFEMERADP